MFLVVRGHCVGGSHVVPPSDTAWTVSRTGIGTGRPRHVSPPATGPGRRSLPRRASPPNTSLVPHCHHTSSVSKYCTVTTQVV